MRAWKTSEVLNHHKLISVLVLHVPQKKENPLLLPPLCHVNGTYDNPNKGPDTRCSKIGNFPAILKPVCRTSQLHGMFSYSPTMFNAAMAIRDIRELYTTGFHIYFQTL